PRFVALLQQEDPIPAGNLPCVPGTPPGCIRPPFRCLLDDFRQVGPRPSGRVPGQEKGTHGRCSLYCLFSLNTFPPLGAPTPPQSVHPPPEQATRGPVAALPRPPRAGGRPRAKKPPPTTPHSQFPPKTRPRKIPSSPPTVVPCQPSNPLSRVENAPSRAIV